MPNWYQQKSVGKTVKLEILPHPIRRWDYSDICHNPPCLDFTGMSQPYVIIGGKGAMWQYASLAAAAAMAGGGRIDVCQPNRNVPVTVFPLSEHHSDAGVHWF